MTAFAELQVTTNYSFLRGASHAEELATAAAAMGLRAIGVADRNSLAGVVRAHVAARQAGIGLLVGARLVLRDGLEIICYPRDRAAYGRLCDLLTRGKRRAGKGDCELHRSDLEALGGGQFLIVQPPRRPGGDFQPWLAGLAASHPGEVFLAAFRHYHAGELRRLAELARLAENSDCPLLASNDVAYHEPARKLLLDVLTCIREGCRIEASGFRLEANAERHLKSPEEMARLFVDYPEALTHSLDIVAGVDFSLDDLRYEYPEEIAPDGTSPGTRLAQLAWNGAARRYPGGVPDKVRAQIVHELELIAGLGYEPYFLTVYELVRFARERGILCQGRGSAANSAVCYCLGVTAVDPSRLDLLFERFMSSERGEPPDIDVDFEHERREEVIQHIYETYGRDRAGLTATVIRYRSRGALRDVGKVMGLSSDTLGALAGNIWGWSREEVPTAGLRAAGLDPDAPRLRQTLEIVRALIGFPRHLSQHVGGFVMTRGPLRELVPIENAAMADRTVIEWDKDDLDALGILKVDVLALGMLTCLRKGFDLLACHKGLHHNLASVPVEDSKVYDMLCRADSIGVFQVESRAQMSMLPRLKPRDFYDLVVEVAIVRPGPIQGDMVHPYLRRRSGAEKVCYPSDALRAVLEKTLGVPLFQEQAMKIAIVAAGFTPAEADQLRRAMATFKNTGTIHKFREKMVHGMVERGYDEDFAERCFRQIEGFGTYGFPESHAASFALLVYVSAWMKCHHPEVFAAALLNSQPMGFYAPAQIVRDAREHGVEVLPVDVNHSDWDYGLEPGSRGTLALRIGLRQIKGLAEAEAKRLVSVRGNGYPDIVTLWRRARLSNRTLEVLARADAFASLERDRRQALWEIKGLPDANPLPLFAAAQEEERGPEPVVTLPDLAPGQQVVEDYLSLRLSLRAHPLSFLRARLEREGWRDSRALKDSPDGCRLGLAGLVLVRQRPGTARGVIFATLEDEWGVANIVIWPDLFEKQRAVVMKSSLLAVQGRLQKEGLVIHLIADQLYDLSPRLAELEMPATAFAGASGRADEARHPTQDRRQARHPALHRSRDFH
ncbi:error-prone DNA polymerase [Limibacillus halophilus]|uniref:Error-prone DNA polymerase n=1 Tax=Limibacillus halophilus TaxID=1579333 RepID=A0A839SU10_9PROT|nr:error-prone DNA polymerase [Limibacillus halophilus]MBB3064465.1 error-prone DNA polymerase [Limibacillus halophilus]